MPTPKTPHRKRLDELLADGVWHDRADLVARTVGVVPPGVATRHARRARERQRELDAARAARAGRTQRPPQGGQPAGDDARVGARDLVVRAIRSAVSRGALERRTLPDGTVQIRRRPETGGE